MPEIYIFNQHDKPLTIITEETGLVSAPVRIELNGVPDTPFSFTVEADTDVAKYVKEENKVVYRDHEGDLRLVVIRELDDSDSIEGSLTTATCEPEFMELAETFVLDRRFTDKTAQEALDAALLNTGYVGEVEVELGLASTNFYRLPVVDAVFDIIATWGGEFKDVVEFDTDNNIIARKIKILQRLGADTGQRFEIDHNITEIGRTVLSYPKTAMYGWGASLETDGGGNTRYIDFGDVVWSKANGDPVDKPKGQMWVGDPEAFENYKRYRDGAWRHRFGEFSNQDYEEPEELLWATWNNLQSNNKPVVNYRLSVDLFDDKVSLGDTAIAIDRIFARPIEIQSRIIAIEYDLLDIDGTMIVEMGQHLNLDDDRLDDLERDVEKLKNTRPSAQVTEDSYPNRKPSTPINVRAIGSFETIQLYWDYADEIFIKHYEVYGSQVADFVPDSQHLLWRGQVSAFGHMVNTDESWYYYIRAVNYHRTPSDWSVRVDASTLRIKTDDILFGSVTADLLADNLDLANKLDQGTLDWINNEPLYQIEEMNNRLLGQIDNKVEIVDYQNAMIDVNEDLNRINLSVVNVQGEVDNAVAQITAIDASVGNLTFSVSEVRTDLDGLEIGTTNLAENSKYRTLPPRNTGASSDNYNYLRYYSVDGLIEGEQYTFRARIEITHGIFNQITLLEYSGSGTRQNVTIDGNGYVSMTFTAKAGTDSVLVYAGLSGSTRGQGIIVHEAMLVLGNKIGSWQPAPEDMADKAQLISYINLSSEDITINSNRINLQGDVYMVDGRTVIGDAVVGTAAIANLAVEKFHLNNGIIDDVHINNMSGEKIIAKTVTADQLNVTELRAITSDMGTMRAGRLLSNNNNMDLNLNTGALRMSNANFSLGGNANIHFTDRNNRLYYVNNSVYAGIQFDHSLGSENPMIGIGISDLKHDVNDPTFRGIRIHSLNVEGTQEFGVNAITQNFRMNALADMTGSGFEFKLNALGGTRRSIFPLYTGVYNYDLGVPANRWSDVYLDRLRTGGDGSLIIRDTDGNGGYRFDTRPQNDGYNTTFRGESTVNNSYNIGNGIHRFSYIFLRNQPDVLSDERLKEDLKINELGLDFINDIDTKTFRLKPTGSEVGTNPLQFGIIAQQLRATLIKHGVDILNISMLSQGADDMYGVQHEQFIPMLIKSDQDLDIKFSNEISWLKTDNQLRDNEITVLRNELNKANKRIKTLEEKVA